MGASAFRQGSIVEIKGQSHQLLRKVDANLWQIEESRSKRLREYTDTQLRQLYVDGTLKFPPRTVLSTVTPQKLADPVDYRPDQWETAKIRRMYVVSVLTVPSTRARITPIALELWQRLRLPAKCPSTSAVLGWKRRYIAAGKDITSLIDRDGRKGRWGSRYPPEVERIVQEAIDSKFMTLERKTLQDALDHAQDETNKENENRPDGAKLPRPTRRLMARMIAAISAEDRCIARYGRIEADKRFRAVLQHRSGAAPLDHAQMDHTLLDLMVVDDETGVPLGRPWLTVCLDTYTRCVLGIYIGFEPPSYFTVARCLEHALRPKANLQKDYPGIKNSWEAHGVVRILHVDNGPEFHSTSLINACYTLGIEIQYSPRRKPWFKGHVERLIGTFNRAIAHGIPGTTFGSILEKFGYDPSKHAVVSMSVLKEITHMWVADVYHQKLHRAWNASPAAVWATSIAAEDIEVPDDLEQLKVILGRSDVRMLTQKGIELGGLLYNSPELADLRKKFGSKLDVEVRIDDSNIGAIHVLHPDGKQALSVGAVRADYAAGLSRWQHDVCRRYAADRLGDSSTDGWLEAKARVAACVFH